MLNDQKVSVSFVESTSATFAKNNPSSVVFPVPQNVKLFLRPFSDGSYLLRLQSFSTSAVSVSIPTGWQISELTLSANQLQADWAKTQYKWNKEAQTSDSELPARETSSDPEE